MQISRSLVLRRRQRAAKFCAALLATLLFLASSLEAQVPQDLQLTPMGLSLSSPLAVRSAFDGTGRLFIAERNGALLVHTPPSTLEVFLDHSADVDSFFEGGLLGVAFHPSFAQNGYFYVSYTRSGSGSSPLTSVIERYTVSSGDPDRADPLSGVDILTLAQPRGNHNGGDLHFGPDGFLYFGLGDGGGGDNVGNSQDLSTWHGKMLRIDPCDTPSCAVPYAIPSGNPYAATAGLDEIWSSGLRNPYRFSFDRQTGDLIIADVGQGSREEVNVQSAGVAQQNYGWPCREGDISGVSSCSGSFSEPAMVYPHTSGNCSITGGYRYRGCIQGLRGRYLFADYCTAKIFIGTESSSGNWTVQEEFDLSGNVLGFGEDEAGEVYVLQGQQMLRFESPSDCVSAGIHGDDFETGDFSNWSDVIPNLP